MGSPIIPVVKNDKKSLHIFEDFCISVGCVSCSCHTGGQEQDLVFKPGYVFDFSKANFSLIHDFLLESDFSIVFEYNDLEFIWFLLKSLIFEAINLFVPKNFVRDSQDPKWFNSEIRHLEEEIQSSSFTVQGR